MITIKNKTGNGKRKTENGKRSFHLSALSFALLVFTFHLSVFTFMACTGEDAPAHPAESAALHITSVTIDGGSVGTRAVYEETASHTYPYNRTFTALEVGDKLEIAYNFQGGPNDTWDNVLSARLVKTANGWDIQDKDGAALTIRPAEGEKWEDLYIEFIDLSNGKVNGSENSLDYTTVASAMGVVQGSVSSDASCIYGDYLVASAEPVNIAAGSGTVTVDTDINSPTLGAMTIHLKHFERALFRLPVAEVKVTEGTYLVGGKEYTNPTLATLWAALDNGSECVPFTQVTINGTEYLQAIVETKPLTGFKAVMQSGDETFTLDLPFQVGTSTEASAGLTLQANTRYPLTLSISPTTSNVSLTGTSSKPEWGTESPI